MQESEHEGVEDIADEVVEIRPQIAGQSQPTPQRMTSAEFWKSPIPRPKPPMKLKSRTATAAAKPLPSPGKGRTEIKDGREYKVTVYAGFSGQAAPRPDKKVSIGAQKIIIAENGSVSMPTRSTGE